MTPKAGSSCASCEDDHVESAGDTRRLLVALDSVVRRGPEKPTAEGPRNQIVRRRSRGVVRIDGLGMSWKLASATTTPTVAAPPPFREN
jgi:hypothetical protein